MKPRTSGVKPSNSGMKRNEAERSGVNRRTARRRRPTPAALALALIAGVILGVGNGGLSTAPAVAAEGETPGTEAADDATDVAPAPADAPPEPRQPDAGTASDAADAAEIEDQSDEVFVPSEDISEDIEVAFPVDI